MGAKKFTRAELILNSPGKNGPFNHCPNSFCRCATWKQYLGLKLQETEIMLNEQRVPDAVDVPGLMSIIKPKARTASSKNVRVTVVYGSMVVTNVLHIATELKIKSVK